jgi:hypothetical protein
MRKVLLVSFVLLAAALAPFLWTRPAPAQSGAAAPPDNTISFRVIFGEKQMRAEDYSGSVSLTAGKVVRIAPWRFFGQDEVQGTRGWKLQIKSTNFGNQPEWRTALDSLGPVQNLVPAGVDITAEAPASATAQIRTAQGNFDIALKELQPSGMLSFRGGDVLVERTPTVHGISESKEEHDYPSITVTRNGTVWTAWQAYSNNGDHVYARHSTAAGWSQTFRLTDQKGDIYKTSVAEDAKGRVWVVWAERTNEDWDLYARAYDGRAWSARRKLTSGSSPNLFPRLIPDKSGTPHLLWVGFQNGQSHVFVSKLTGDSWSAPAEISGAGTWAPEGAFDSKGNLYVVWDSYRTGNYDIFLRRVAPDGTMGKIQQVTESPLFQAHPTVAVDKQDRVWIAWDESAVNWGKDWNHDDPYRGATLYSERRPRVAVLENGKFRQPEADLAVAMPQRYSRFIELPRIACDAQGRIWVALEARTSTGTNRPDFFAGGGKWEHFLTTLEGGQWTPAMPIPDTASRPETPFQVAAGTSGIWMAWTTDNRPFGAGRARRESMSANAIAAAPFRGSGAPPAPLLKEFSEPAARYEPVHPNEAADVARIRAYRTDADGSTCRIMRGDFHRHTEISSDGAGDGSVEDYFRYMLDAAEMDTGIISDHNAGNNDEYTWWRTEKAIDIFHIRSRFTPLFGYERSVSYPNGHRNVVFPERGVRTLPISPEEQKGKVNSGPILYPYLRQNRGICMEHSLATNQGTDWRDNDPNLEPLVEIYQGYHASYEYEGAPRAETENFQVRVHGGYKPAGFYWNALAKGYKLGVQSSSDHISTHCSYTLIYTPTDRRADIVESMRRRHAYGATDNIIVDYRAVDGQGRAHFMGDSFQSKSAPKLSVKVIGTDRIAKVEIVRNGKFIFQTEPNGNTADFTYVDSSPAKGENWHGPARFGCGWSRKTGDKKRSPRRVSCEEETIRGDREQFEKPLLLLAFFLLRGGLLLALLLLLLLCLRGLILAKHHGNRAEQQGHAKHQSDQFLHCVSPFRKVTNSISSTLTIMSGPHEPSLKS